LRQRLLLDGSGDSRVVKLECEQHFLLGLMPRAQLLTRRFVRKRERVVPEVQSIYREENTLIG